MTKSIAHCTCILFCVSDDTQMSSASAAAIRHLTFEVFGTVQGVFFRKHTESEAKKLGLKGWCANTKQNTVQGEAFGPAEKIEVFKKWLRHTGSPKSKITDAKFTERDAAAHEHTTFEVRR
jgi:acylphosphatase